MTSGNTKVKHDRPRYEVDEAMVARTLNLEICQQKRIEIEHGDTATALENRYIDSY